MEEATILIKKLREDIEAAKSMEDKYLKLKHETKDRIEFLQWDSWVSYWQGRRLATKEILEEVESNFTTECIECGETVTVKETLNGICTKCMANGLMGP